MGHHLPTPRGSQPVPPQVRTDIMANLNAAERNPMCKAVVLIGSGKTFPAGADITEFGTPSQGGLRWLSRAVLLYSPCA